MARKKPKPEREVEHLALYHMLDVVAVAEVFSAHAECIVEESVGGEYFYRNKVYFINNTIMCSINL